MIEHLPECWAKDPSDPEAWCICDELRACEQRVRKDEQSHFLTRYLLGRNGGGYQRGLDAAREAVVALCWRKQYEGFVSTVDPQRVLAAIDALKESK